MDFKDAFNYGLPTVLLFALIGGLWKMIVWAKTAVVEPVVTSHLALIRALQEELNVMIEASKRREEKMNEVAKVAADVAIKQEEALSGIEQTTDNQTHIIKQTLETQTQILKHTLEEQTKTLKDTLDGHITIGGNT